MDSYKYYFIRGKRDEAYPLVNLLNLSEYRRELTDKIRVGLRNPVPRTPVMTDFHFGDKTVLHKRIADVMQSLNMEGVEFIPAEIDVKGEIYDDYVCVIVDNNTYEALDKEKSDFFIDEDTLMYNIKRLALDRDVLAEIPLSKRLGMRLKEAPGYYLFHQSVVDAVMALEPKGMYFQDIEESKV